MEIGILAAVFFAVFAASIVFCAYWFGEQHSR